MKNIGLLVGVLVSAAAAADADLRGLDAAAAEALHVVRELGVDGQPAIWNAHAVQFMYPPQFDFRPLAGAVKYRFDVIDDAARPGLDEPDGQRIRHRDGDGRGRGGEGLRKRGDAALLEGAAL